MVSGVVTFSGQWGGNLPPGPSFQVEFEMKSAAEAQTT